MKNSAFNLRHTVFFIFLSWFAWGMVIGCSTDDSGEDDGSNTPTDSPDRGRERDEVGSDFSDASEDTEDTEDTDIGSIDSPDQAGTDTTDFGGAPDSPPNSDAYDDNCPDDARDIYLVDAYEEALYRFDPYTGDFNLVLYLDCPAGGFYTPHSMAVSRDAEPYILYQDGAIYHIDQGGLCTQTSFSEGYFSDWARFGMGFAMNSRYASEDTLFIANETTLGSIDLSDFSISELGPLGGGIPELSGTGEGALWGFFPQTDPPRIAEIDKTNGSLTTVYELDLSSDANAWAFAFWGGHFYIFYKTFSDPSTNVYRMSEDGGDLELIIEDSGFYIVGAGVSTCAPVKWPDEE